MLEIIVSIFGLCIAALLIMLVYMLIKSLVNTSPRDYF